MAHTMNATAFLTDAMELAQPRIMHRLFTTWGCQKEEAWLNDMAKEGWILSDAGFGRYIFDACTPGAHTVQIRRHLAASSDYDDRLRIASLEQEGLSLICRRGDLMYFRK